MKTLNAGPRSLFATIVMAQVAILMPGLAASSSAQTPAVQRAAPANGHYVGLTKCAACHFQYYENWKSSPHGKAFDILPVKYRADASCLKCHLTGHDAAAEAPVAAHQTGVSCEACHGPGSEHANLALSFVGQEKLLSEDALKALREKIQKTSLNQCIKCHTSMAHKPHPLFERDARTPAPAGR